MKIYFLLITFICHVSLFCCTQTISANQPSIQQPQKLFLQKIEGGLPKKSPQTKICSIYREDSRINSKLLELDRQVVQASKESEIKSFHIMAQTPSIEIYVFLNDRKITLVNDHSTRKERNGPAAKSLIKLARELCVPKKP